MVGVIKVAPRPPYDHPRRPATISKANLVCHKVYKYFQRLQIGRRERYSVERMLSLRDYCEQTSPFRAIVLCLLAPLPAFTTAMLIECIPLAPASDGWQANYFFWIRHFLTSFFMAICGVVQVKQVLPRDTISIEATLGIGVSTATGYVVCAMTCAALWTFPIPFGYVLMVGPFVFFFMGSLGFVIGRRSLSSASSQRVLAQLSVLASLGLLAGSYPPFFAIYRQLSGVQQTAYFFVMPIIKVINKQYIAKQCAQWHEYVGPMVVFSVDVCNVLYTVICIQTAVSSRTTMFKIISDVSLIFVTLYKMYHQSNPIQESLASRDTSFLCALPALVHEAYQIVERIEVIRVCAPFPLSLSKESKELLLQLQCKSTDVSPHLNVRFAFTSPRIVPFQRRLSLPDTEQFKDGIGVTPVCISDTPAMAQKPSTSSNHKMKTESVLRRINFGLIQRSFSLKTLSRHELASSPSTHALRSQNFKDQVQDALQALFCSEYILLCKYVECVLPILYIAYVAILHYLPTSQYYPYTRSITDEQLKVVLKNMALYGLVGIASFIAITALLKRKIGFFPLYQVAFVLETHAQALQSLLYLWVLCILQFTLVHNGVDLDAPFQALKKHAHR